MMVVVAFTIAVVLYFIYSWNLAAFDLIWKFLSKGTFNERWRFYRF
jgi:hypothetical protein